MRRFLSYLLFALTVAIPSAAIAALGGNVDSITRDQSHARAQLRTVPSNGYTIRETITEANVNIREYVSTNGVVFAVAWNGSNLPDLTQLLGDYFPAFRAAMIERQGRGIRGPVALQQDDLVVESNGHMRAYFGRAYVPSLLPPQVSIDEIQ